MNKKWDRCQTKFWDLGYQDPPIRMSEKNLSNILKAVITCEAEITDTYCAEKAFGSSGYQYLFRNCCVAFRIKLPIGAEEDFQKLSGFKLTEPIKVHLN